jgi:uncharacterized membrane-anchored protein
MEYNYKTFAIFIHLMVAFIFLADILKSQLPTSIYVFLTDNRNTIFGIYYIYIAYNIFIEKIKNNNIE